MSILRVERLVSGYGTMEVLHDVSLEVPAETIVGLLGPNGAGKTTLLRSICGVVKPRTGRIFFLGQEITGFPPERVARLGICYVPQEQNVFPSLTVQENLEMGAFIREDDWRGRLQEVYDFFPDLTNRRRSRAGELSGGMRQMLAIGRALMLNPRLLLLDEPSAGLAPLLVEHIFERVRSLQAQGLSILLVEQNVQVLRSAHRACILEGGQVKAEGTAREMLEDEEIGRLYLGR